MKSITEYIKEALSVYRLNNVTVTYDVHPSTIILQAPATFSESDVQIYMGDLWLDKMPSNYQYSSQLFGMNNDNIYDVYFTYDTFEHQIEKPESFIAWDSKFDANASNSDTQLDYFKITNVKYVISFDRFDLVDIKDDEVKGTLEKIFKSAESNNLHEWAVNIKFDKDNLKFNK